MKVNMGEGHSSEKLDRSPVFRSIGRSMDTQRAVTSLVSIFLAATFTTRAFSAGVDWPVYLGDQGSSHYSGLRQINQRNVHTLEVAWVFNSGDGRKDDRWQI